jgi:aryl-alcohol dehydrogenase-like predicted oxidoreductase
MCQDVQCSWIVARHLHGALNTSLGRLRVETIDLYQLHASVHTPAEETLSFLDEAVKTGKIRYVGPSNYGVFGAGQRGRRLQDGTPAPAKPYTAGFDYPAGRT